ncbi:MAG: hypothetical protein OXR66_07425 [Candidatus Woesearchaeota archaeon]|nr:hypothetical protein [Candidatus Woesearchaeota archaeon]
MAFKEDYATLSLPPYDELNAEFDLSAVADDCARPAKEVAKKIFERVDGFKKILESLLQPESVIEMEEAGKLTEKQQQEIAAVIQSLMRIDRELLVAELENTDEAYVHFVNTAWAAWPSVKEKLQPIVQLLRDNWSVQKKLKITHHYLG